MGDISTQVLNYLFFHEVSHAIDCAFEISFPLKEKSLMFRRGWEIYQGWFCHCQKSFDPIEAMETKAP